MSESSELQELRAEVDQLRAVVNALTATQAAAQPSAGAEPEGFGGDPTAGRRHVLKLAAASAAAAVAGSVASSANPAAAASGDPVRAGLTTTAQQSTELRYQNNQGLSHHVLWVQDGGRSIYPENPFPRTAAISGWATGAGWVADGIQGVSEIAGYGGNFDGRGATAFGSASGIRVQGQRATIHLLAKPGNSIDANFDRQAGEMVYDPNGDLWLCVTGGNPGSWRKLAGPAAAGSFHAIDPIRVYDSRVAQPGPGPLAPGTTRTISVRDGRDLTTGAVTVAGVVPAGATAIAYNLVVTGTVGQGFLSVNPGGNTTVSASSINWSASGQSIANGLVVKLSADRTVTVICGGGTTDVLIDVLGYYR